MTGLSAFIIKYWLEIFFSLIATGAGFVAKRFRDLYIKEKAHEKELEQKNLRKNIKEELLDIIKKNRNESREDDRVLESKIDNLKNEIQILKSGMLAVQGSAFKKECRRLLQSNSIGLEEWDALSADHEVYHSLGGNHDGDRLYNAVSVKYQKQLEND